MAVKPQNAAAAAVMCFVLAAALVAPFSIYVREFLAVDSCLDAGGSYDYIRGRCDRQINHPYISFRERHGLLAASFPWLLLTSAIIAAIGFVFARRARRGPTPRSS